MPPKTNRGSSKRKHHKNTPERIVTRSTKERDKIEDTTVSRNLLADLSESDTVSDPETISPVFKRSKSLADLSTETSPDSVLDDSLIFTHSQSATDLSPKPYNKLSELEKSMISLSSSLQILTSNVTTITSSMVTKSDLKSLETKFQDVEIGLTESVSNLATDLKKHDKILVSNSDARNDLSDRINANAESVKTCISQHSNLSNRIDGLATVRTKSAQDFQTKLDELNENLVKQQAEITALRNEQGLQAKAINSQLKQPAPSVPIPNAANLLPPSQNTTSTHSVLNIIVEGLAEEPGEKLVEKFLLVCECMGVNLPPGAISNANRIVRRNPIAGRPNPVKFAFTDVKFKENVMRHKASLQSHEDLKSIWINHDESTQVRRAKGRARHIATFARKKGSFARLDAQGITIDNAFYPYDNLQAIPSIYIPPSSLTIPTGRQLPDTRPDLVRPRPPTSAAEVCAAPAPLANPPTTKGHSSQIFASPPLIATTTITASNTSNSAAANRDYHQHGLPPPTWLKPSQAQVGTAAAPHEKPIDPFPTTRTWPNQRPTPNLVILPNEKMKQTKMGLVYSGPSARFSHLYKIGIVIEGRPFNSVEQKIQHDKAILARELKIAEEIMDEENTHRIMRLGDKIPLSLAWIKARRLSAGSFSKIFLNCLNQFFFILQS